MKQHGNLYAVGCEKSMEETARATDAVSETGTQCAPTHLQGVEGLRPPRRDAFRLTRTAWFGSVPTILPR